LGFEDRLRCYITEYEQAEFPAPMTRHTGRPPFIDLAWFEQAYSKSKRITSFSQQSRKIFEYDRLRWVCSADGAVQSMMFLDDHSYPVLHYVKALLCALLFVKQPRNLLNIGLGSGAIERYLLSHLPEIQLVSIEPKADMISLSRESFFLASNHPVIEEKAQSFLKKNKQKFDIIITDIHPGPGEINPVQTDSFLQDLVKSLARQGIVTINFLPDTEDEIVKTLVRLRQAFNQVILYDVPAQQNIVLYCLNTPPPYPDKKDLLARTKQSQFNPLEAESIYTQMIYLPD
jgi:spermidine synthase